MRYLCPSFIGTRGRPLSSTIRIVAMFGCLQAALSLTLFQQVLAGPVPRHKEHYAPDGRGAVASESSICSAIGINLLRDGGNAADALVGTTFCTGVVAMYHSGIGGGGFMLVRAPNRSYEYIDFRETAPAAAFQDMYRNNTRASIFGGLAR